MVATERPLKIRKFLTRRKHQSKVKQEVTLKRNLYSPTTKLFNHVVIVVAALLPDGLVVEQLVSQLHFSPSLLHY